MIIILISIVIGIIVLIVAFICLAALYFTFKVISPVTSSYEASLDYELSNNRISKQLLEKYNKQEVEIDSKFGYKLYGWFFECENSLKTVVICHGITCNVISSLKYMELFRKRGYNVLIYDHRNHGRSGGKYTTFGYYEKYDLKSWVDWIYERYGNAAKVGTLGESLGAIVALQNTAIDDRLAFCVADCAASDLFSLLKYRLEVEYHLPAFPLLQVSSFLCWLITGMSYYKVSPIQAIKTVNTPIFFVHGAEDTYIPTKMSKQMYEVKKGLKKIYIAEGAGHATSLITDSTEYEKQLNDFLNMINF